MLETFRGIVLRTVKYGDTSLVVDLYTREYGRKSFTTSSARIKRSVCGVSFWQPMSMLEMTADIRQASSRLPRLADVRSYRCYSDLPYSPVKSTLALFLAEFLCGALKESGAPVVMANFLITRKFTKGRPGIFLFMLFLAATLLSMLTSGTAAILMMYQVADGLMDACG